MNKLLSLALICLSAMTMKAQVKAEPVQVFYPVGQSAIRPDFMHNGEQLQSTLNTWDAQSIDWNRYQVVIRSSSSPEGRERFNKKISERRAASLADYLVKHAGVTREHIIIKNQGTDWAKLRQLIQQSALGCEGTPYVHYLDSVINLINHQQDIKDHKVLAGLRKVYNGWKYPYIRRYLFPKLRYARATIEPIKSGEVPTPMRPQEEAVPLPPVTIPEPPALPAVSGSPADTTATTTPTTPTTPTPPVVSGTPIDTPAPVLPAKERRPLYLAAKTNMLYDAILLPNVGLEWAFDKHWSIGANWAYTWISNDSKHRYWRIYGGDAELRYWLGGPDVKPLTGHHFGAYGGIVTYDIEFGGKGYLGDRWSYFFGLSYGYSMPIARRLNIDFTLGIGYLGGEYKEYRPKNGYYFWEATKQRKWFGPTKAEISLVWLIGHGNTNKKGKKNK